MSPSSSPRVWRGSILLSAGLFAVGLLELSARRGWAINLYLVNKVLGGTALLLVALAVCISAFCLFWGVDTGRRAYARPLGLVAYVYAAAHVLLTLVVGDPEQGGAVLKFPFPAYYLEHWPSILCSIVAFVFLTLLFVRSIRTTHAGKRRQLRWLSFAVVCLGFVHALLLKVAGWVTWMQTFEPALPPLSLLALTIVFALILIKIAHLIVLRRSEG